MDESLKVDRLILLCFESQKSENLKNRLSKFKLKKKPLKIKKRSQMSPQGSIFIWHVSQQKYLVPNDIINARKFYSLLSATTDNVCEKRVSEVDIHERKERDK